VWTAPTESGTSHQVTVSGLTHSSSYHLDVTATTADGRSAVAQFLLTTPDLNGPVHASTANGAILLNGQPSFPKMVFDQCPDAAAGNLAVGIDTFMGNACGSGGQLASWLNGTAFVVANAEDRAASRPTSGSRHAAWTATAINSIRRPTPCARKRGSRLRVAPMRSATSRTTGAPRSAQRSPARTTTSRHSPRRSSSRRSRPASTSAAPSGSAPATTTAPST